MRTREKSIWRLAAGVVLLAGVLLLGGKPAQAAEITVKTADSAPILQATEPDTVCISHISNQKRWIVLRHTGLDREAPDGKNVARYVYLRRAKGQKNYHVIGQYVLNQKEQSMGSKLDYAVRDVNAQNGSLYRYRVGILFTDGSEGLSKTVRMCRLTRPTVCKTTSKHCGSMGIWWQPNQKADGYYLYYGTSEKELYAETNYKRVKSGSKNKTTLCHLQEGQKYYFYLKAYKDVGGQRYYSTRSKIVSAVIRK